MYRVITEYTFNDSNKDIIVPAGRLYKLEWAYAFLIATATVGNRQMILEMIDTDGSTVLALARAGAVQTATQANTYNFAPGAQRGAAFVGSQIDVPIMPNFMLTAAMRIRIRDSAAIDAAADDLMLVLGINDMSGTSRDQTDFY
jgi:hypothetical protein